MHALSQRPLVGLQRLIYGTLVSYPLFFLNIYFVAPFFPTRAGDGGRTNAFRTQGALASEQAP